MASAWSFGLVDLLGVNIGEIYDAHERKFSRGVNMNWTSYVRFDLRDQMCKDVTDREGDVLLLVYQIPTPGATPALKGVLDLVTAEEVFEEGKSGLACTFEGPMGRLEDRLTGKGLFSGPPGGPRGAIIQFMIETLANAERDTGIRMGTIDAPYDVQPGQWFFKPIREAIEELCATRVIPVTLPDMVAATVRDNFVIGADAALNGSSLTAPSGHVWAAAGGDGAVTFVNRVTSDVVRGTSVFGDNPGNAVGWANHGSYAEAGTTTFTDVVVSAELGWDSWPAVSSGTPRQKIGVEARQAPGVPGRAVACLDLVRNGIAVGYMNTNGGEAEIAFYQLPTGSLALATYYQMIFQIDANGDYAVWFYLSGAPPSGPRILDHSEVFNISAAGGAPTYPLNAAGKVGLFHQQTCNAGQLVAWKNFNAKIPTSPLVGQDLNYRFNPVVPVDEGADTGYYAPAGSRKVKIATLDILQNVGAVKPEVVFEFTEDEQNVRTAKRVIDRKSITNWAYSLGTGDDLSVVSSKNDASILARGLRERVIASDLQDSGLRKALMDGHVARRAKARRVLNFEPAPGGPVYGVDYVEGDTVTARSYLYGKLRFNGLVRVYGIDVTIDDEGRVIEIPALVQET
jgi:hypothetical protein